MNNIKQYRLSIVLLTIGIASVVLMLITTFFAFTQFKGDNPDKNIIEIHSPVAKYDDTTNIQANFDVPVFSAEYYKDGNIIIKSENGDKVVAPGAEGNGNFSLKNVSSYKVNCDCEFIGDNSKNLPISCALQDNTGAYIIGSKTDYVEVSKLNEAHKSYTLEPSEVVTFSLPWKWISRDDISDTTFGNDSKINISVGISTNVEIVPEEQANSNFTNFLPWIFAIVAIICIGAGIGTYIRRHRQ
ncbi:MAG: hypothetical protein Q4E88_03015 [Coriobacteriia bacterium]|nr:hypothetical protein [Coriobacteriia bacterium]